MSVKQSRITISTAAILVVFIRHVWPHLQIDTIDIVLFVLALLPWLSGVIKELEIPGFGKIGFQEVKSAGEKIIESHVSSTKYQFLPLQSPSEESIDANLIFVSLRIQIERRINQLAEINNIPIASSLRKVIIDLVKNKILSQSFADGLNDLLRFGNLAAHGASIDPNAALWAKENSQLIIKMLDDLINRAS